MSLELFFNHQRVEAMPGQSLFECAEQLGIQVPTSCRKQGKCRECLVEIEAGMDCLSDPEPAEQNLRDGFRLSCCCRIVKNQGVIRCHTLRRGTIRIERHAFQLPIHRERAPLKPAVTRDANRILLDGQEIASGKGPVLGLAMDLGTTTVVLRLIDLETGETIADTSFENPQRFGGSDVMSRIHFDSLDSSRSLQRILIRYVANAIRSFPGETSNIYELVVTGNSTMRDLFFGLDVQPIGQSPFQSISEHNMAAGHCSTTSLSMPAKSLGLPIHPAARVYGLPIISGHVGADAAACMLATGMAREDRLVAIMDVGTNTEIILGNRKRIMAASCPAGPAFEGGRIACGMPALTGAIERVLLNDQGVAELRVIDDASPEGICGSGLVDTLSELIRTGRLNSRGRFKDGIDRIVLSGGAEPVFLSERDINELAQAKGANAAGLRILFENFGVRFEDVDVFYLAGGFGRHLDVEASKRIGLIPNLPSEKIVQIGNAAIEGASLALVSRDARAELEALAQQVEHVRLETHPMFFDYFVEGCLFGGE
jgi:uncharacterized 2Fe-2S/4Fe-4S cluster protein (DUF4445 family)